MNTIHRSIWNAAKQTYVAVSEKTGLAQSRGSAVKAIVTAVAAAVAAGAQAEPVGTVKTDLIAGSVESVASVLPNFSIENSEGLAPLGESYEIEGITGNAQRLVAAGVKVVLKPMGDFFNSGSVTRFYALNGGEIEVGRMAELRTSEGGTATSFYVGSVDGLDPTPGQNGRLVFKEGNASTIGQIQTSGTVLIEDGASITATAVNFDGAGTMAQTSVTNNGILVVSTVKPSNLSTMDGLGTFTNNGTLQVGQFIGNMRFINEGTATFSNLETGYGEYNEVARRWEASENGGDLTVSGNFIVNSGSTLSDGTALSGRFLNRQSGTVTVGAEGTENGDLSVYGTYINEGTTVVNGVLQIGDGARVDNYGRLEVADVWNANLKLKGGSTFVIHRELDLDEALEWLSEADGEAVVSSPSVVHGDYAEDGLTITGAVNLGDSKLSWEKPIDLAEGAVLKVGELWGRNSMADDNYLGTGKGTVYANRVLGASVSIANLDIDRLVIGENAFNNRGLGHIKANMVEVGANSSFQIINTDEVKNIKISAGTELTQDVWRNVAYESVSFDGGSITFKAPETTIGTIIGTPESVTFAGSWYNAEVKTDGDWFKNTVINYRDQSGVTRLITQVGSGNEFHLGVDAGLGGEKTYVVNRLDGASGNTWILEDGVTLAVTDLDLTGIRPASPFLKIQEGALKIALGDAFDAVTGSADGILGTDIATGETVRIDIGGIQSVSGLKSGFTDAVELTSDSQIIFTDNGWTAAAAADVTNALAEAFGSTGMGSISFSGEAGEEGVFNVDTLNGIATEHTAGVIFATTDFVNATNASSDAAKLTFSDTEAADGNTVKGSFGFRTIANATSVEVEGGKTLHLIGSAEGGPLLLDGDTITVKNGSLVLGGLAETTKGEIGNVALTEEGSSMLVRGGEFEVTDALTGEGAVRVAATGTLKLADTFGFAGSITNEGSLKSDVTLVAGTLENAGRAMLEDVEADRIVNRTNGIVEAGDIIADTIDNGGTIRAGAVTVRDGFRNAGTLSSEQGIELRADAVNEGQIETVMLSSAEGKTFTNAESGVITADVWTGDDLVNKGAADIGGVQGKRVVNDGKLTTAGLTIWESFTNAGELVFKENAADPEHDRRVTLSGDLSKVKNTGSIKGLVELTVNSDLTNDGLIETGLLNVGEDATFTNTKTAAIDKVENALIEGVFENEGTVNAKYTTLGLAGVIDQTESGVWTTDKLFLSGNVFDTPDGTFTVKDIVFADEDEPKTFNVKGGREFSVESGTLANVTYNVTKALTFGSETGLAAKLAEENSDLKSMLDGATGVLTVGKDLTVGADAKLNIGFMPAAPVAVRTFALRAAAEPADANINAAAGSLTVIDASALDGAPAFKAGAEGLTAVIDEDAKLAVTRVEHDGDMTILEGFDLSAYLADGVWTGGWTGDNAIFVNDGSGLDYDIETRYENGSFVASFTMADVATVYPQIAASDLANAALKRDVTGADVAFMRGVIRDRELSVAEKTKLVNSVTQIASTVGVGANFLADTTALMGSAEERAASVTNAGTGLWVNVEGGKYKQDGLKLAGTGEAGYNATSYGFTFGADTAVRNDLTVGAAFSYVKGDADAEGDVLKAENDYETYGIQAYAAWTPCEKGRVIGEIGYFRSSNDVTQTIGFANFGKAEADVDLDALTFGVRADGTFDVVGMKVVPHVGLRGIYTHGDKYETKIDGEKAFESDSDAAFTVQMPIGVTVEKAFNAAGWTVTPKADFTVTPQFGDTDAEVKVTGIGAKATESLTTEIGGKVVFGTALGVEATKGNASVSARYAFTGGDAGRQDHAFMLNASYRF